jgi:hypothetical protein
MQGNSLLSWVASQDHSPDTYRLRTAIYELCKRRQGSVFWSSNAARYYSLLKNTAEDPLATTAIPLHLAPACHGHPAPGITQVITPPVHILTWIVYMNREPGKPRALTSYETRMHKEYSFLALLGLMGEDKLRPYYMLIRTFHN